MSLGPQFNSRTLKGDKGISNTLPSQEYLGGRARHSGTDASGRVYESPRAPLDVEKQWNEVRQAWNNDRAAYDRHTGVNLGQQ